MSTIKITKKDYSEHVVVNKDSSNNIYTITEKALKGNSAIDIDLSASENDIFAKNGNDLVIYSFSFEHSGRAVATVIKDYFKYAPKYSFVSITQTGDYNDVSTYDYNYISSHLTVSDAYFGKITDAFYDKVEYITGKSKDDNFVNKKKKNTDGGKTDFVFDISGNDSYDIQAKAVDRNNRTRVYDFSGNDKYNCSNRSYAYIFDSKGNDIYTAEHSGVWITDDSGNDNYLLKTDVRSEITDNDGNDNYILYNALVYNIYDKKGNDNYIFNESDVFTSILDYAGNDKYSFTDGESKVEDFSGKDIYTIIAEQNDEIIDHSGNEKYTINNTIKTKLTDDSGKDLYNISYSQNIVITDGKENETGSGNDIYNLNLLTKTEDNKNNSVTDYSGNEKYNISNSDYLTIKDKAGNDKYNLSYSSATIIDDRGSDNYILKESIGTIKITDNGTAERIGKKLNTKLANDKYTSINSTLDITEAFGNEIYKISKSNGTITDNNGSDKYDITSSNITIEDNNGQDSYNINPNYFAKIYDNGLSNKDSYNIKGMSGNTVIWDDGGVGDTLKITGAKKNNLVFMVDYIKDADYYTGAVNSGDLIIFDTANSGYTIIKDYFDLESTYIRYENENPNAKARTSDGCIEKIYAGKSNITNTMFNQTNKSSVDALSSSVANWLSDSTTYGSVGEFLTKSGNNSDIADFIAAIYNKN